MVLSSGKIAGGKPRRFGPPQDCARGQRHHLSTPSSVSPVRGCACHLIAEHIGERGRCRIAQIQRDLGDAAPGASQSSARKKAAGVDAIRAARCRPLLQTCGPAYCRKSPVLCPSHSGCGNRGMGMKMLAQPLQTGILRPWQVKVLHRKTLELFQDQAMKQ